MNDSKAGGSKQIRVLFIDDEPDITEQAKIFLEKQDEKLDIETATSAEEGLELLENEEFQIIVSDYKMPEMNGIDLLRTLREKNNDIPFIILTGKGKEEAAMKALNLGADRYFQKGGEPKSQYAVLADAILQVAEHKWIKERNEFLNLLLSRDLKNKIEDIREQLENLKKLEIPEKEKEKLDNAIKGAKEGADLIEQVETIRESELEEEAEKVNLDVLQTFIGYAWSESQLMLSRLWRAYKKVDKHSEILFELAKNTAEHKSLLEKVSRNLGEMELNQYVDDSELEDFKIKMKDEEDILTELMEKENLVLDVYKKLLSLTERPLIESSWKGSTPDSYFEIVERLVKETKEHIKKLEKAKKYIAFGISPNNR